MTIDPRHRITPLKNLPVVALNEADAQKVMELFFHLTTGAGTELTLFANGECQLQQVYEVLMAALLGTWNTAMEYSCTKSIATVDDFIKAISGPRKH